ncbi:unnamed protein product [Ostreobium quekettii]|uniref:Uncharacterized protein n=1 Tax=Ostreobium quekettii TaxID=121088 RepID=A0A8S1IVP1_9CHLO|nr:unnamed protein product [Ostreobium quekettii]
MPWRGEAPSTALLLVIVLLACSHSSDASIPIEPRCDDFDGWEPAPHVESDFVSILKHGKHMCGGYLLRSFDSPFFVVTSAHCADVAGRHSSVKIHDSEEGQVVRVVKTYIHPNWTLPGDFHFDVALMLLPNMKYNQLGYFYPIQGFPHDHFRVLAVLRLSHQIEQALLCPSCTHHCRDLGMQCSSFGTLGDPAQLRDVVGGPVLSYIDRRSGYPLLLYLQLLGIVSNISSTEDGSSLVKWQSLREIKPWIEDVLSQAEDNTTNTTVQISSIVFSTIVGALGMLIVVKRWSVFARPAPEQAAALHPESQCPKYNQEMLGFLAKQLAKVSNLKPPKGATKSSVKDLKHAQQDGDRLLRKHKGPFDLKAYYTCHEVKELVNKICETLWEVVQDWQKGDAINIQRNMPEPCFEEDRKHLHKLLGYILNMRQKETAKDVLMEWRKMKQEYNDQMKDLKMIDEHEVKVVAERGRGSGSIVYEGLLGSVPVAVKKCRIPDSIEQDIERLAEFMKDVLVHLSVKSFHVAELYAMTKTSCWLVMELADKDLRVFCQERKPMGWPMKLNLLQQASERLYYMHSHDPSLVHSDIKTSNFLVSGNKPIVKIADFGQTREYTNTLKFSVRKAGGTREYKPPEVYEGEVPSLPSDVYSFGIVMYEVVTGRMLYEVKGLGRQRSDAYIINEKLQGEPPCELGVNDCPKEMEELMQECIQLDPRKRPEMQEVCDRLKQMPIACGEKNSVEYLHTIVDSARQQLHYVQYNERILSFLFQQMECVKGLNDLPPGMSSDAWKTLKGALESGERLIEKHTYTFDLHKFYSADELKVLVERLCTSLQDAWGSVDEDGSVPIRAGAPDGYVAEDREFLNTCLRFVLYGEQASEDSADIGDEWHQVRKKHNEQMENLRVVPDNEIELEGAEEIGTGGEGTIYKWCWQGKMVAAKQLHQKVKHLRVERLAQVFTTAALSASMHHGNIASVLAVSASGDTLLMELATENLMTWYRRNRKASWRSKVGVMYQAASGLAHVHGRPETIVHCDVKTTNFLVFGDDSQGDPVVKLCDFGTLTTGATDAKTTLKQQPRTPLYCAPEIDNCQPHTHKSDVFSFGVVLCEVAVQRAPYRGGEGLAAKMKELGEMLCRIPADYPKGLRTVINECLSREPGMRPSMRHVEETLLMVLQDLDSACRCNGSDD